LAKSKTVTGIAASPGFGVGRALVLATPEAADSRRIQPAQVEGELARLASAVERAAAELRQALGELEDLGEKTSHAMVEVELMVLEDPATLAAFQEQVRKEHLAAEGAVQAVAAPFAMRYSQSESKVFQDRAWELAAAFRAVINHLQRREMPHFGELTEPVIVVARDLAPHETIRFDAHRDKIAGIATERGGRTSHFAILARTSRAKRRETSGSRSTASAARSRCGRRRGRSTAIAGARSSSPPRASGSPRFARPLAA
jgi:phosphotransferase system enzyme I (PtsI)